MPFSVKLDSHNGIVFGEITGVCDTETSRQALTELWNLPGWDGNPVIWDVRAARIKASSDDIRSLAQFILANQPTRPPSRVAFVTDAQLDFGLMRMLEIYREDPRTDTRVLRDLDEAIAWTQRALSEPDSDPA